MQENHKTNLMSSEITGLWSAYMNNSMTVCIMKYFLKHVEDSDVSAVLEFALNTSQTIVLKTSEVLKEERHPIPVGFTDADVNLTAPRLFSDSFYLLYIKNMSKVASSTYATALATLARSDIRDLFTQWVNLSTELYNKTADVLLKKGLFIRHPYVTVPDNVQFVREQSYLGGLFNEVRPLNIIEITHLVANLETNVLGQNLLAGLSQVAKSKEVHQHCLRGKEISKKQVQVYSTTLLDSDVQAPMSWDLKVTDATTPPFSDKLMMFQVALIGASGLSNLATAGAASLRTDVGANYVRFAAEISKYNLDGAKLIIKNGWMEEPPQPVNHDSLVNSTH